MLQTKVPGIGGADIHSPDKFLTFHQLNPSIYEAKSKAAEEWRKEKKQHPNHFDDCFNLYLKCSNIIILINQCQQTYQGPIFSYVIN